MTDDADALVERLGLEPHPEGGCYRRVHTADEVVDGRPVESAILYLLRAGERSHWHRIDAAETWAHEDGAPMEIRIAAQAGRIETHVVTADRSVTVPPHAWQAAASTGTWSLVRCTVRPAFTFDGFELAPDGWEPDGDA